VMTIDTIPLTTNGKVDHRALPSPDLAAFTSEQYVAPRTPVEERLAAVWCEVLGLSQVGVEDSFFDLGGDSIRAVRLVGALRAAGYDASIPDVFQLKTIAALAGRLAGQEAGAALVAAVAPFALIGEQDRASLPTGVVDAYPLSQVQTGMLIEMLAAGDGNVYRNINSFRIPDTEAFDAAAMRRAVDTVVARHDILRTTMHLDGFSQPLQLVHGTVGIPLAVHDLRGQSAEQQAEHSRAFVADEHATGFDLAAGPLLRLAVHIEADDAWRLTFSHIHATTDGWTVNSLLMELVAVYRALRDGREPAAFEAPSVRFADFIAAEQASLASESDQAFWQGVLDAHAPMVLPAAWAEEAEGGPAQLNERVPFADLEDGLRRLAAATGTALKSVLLAAHLKVLGALTTEEAFHTGVVYHGRLEAPGADRVLGMHLNTLPFPASRGSRTWRELVAGVYRQETEIWSHRRYPLPAIQRAAGSVQAQDLLSTVFECHDFHQVDAGSVDVGATLGDGANEFALAVIAAGGRINLGTSGGVLGRAALVRLGAMYRAVLEAMAADPFGDATGPVLPEADRALLLGAWNAPTGQPVTATVHELFAAVATASPDAVALTSGARQLTYRELDERANRLAHHLVAAGAGPDVIVGVCLERDENLIPTLLGVLKSGAAYLPLDPVNPAERLAYMLDDAQAPILVTHSAVAAPEFAGTRILLDRDADAIAAHPATAPVTTTTPDNLIYVIYTSGSTGLPKGVCLTHANVARHFAATAGQFGFSAADVVTQSHSYAFDVSVWEMWSALLHGGRLVVVPPAVGRSPEDLLDLLVRERVTVLLQTPTAFRSLSALAADGDPRIGRLALRLTGFGGERLEPSELRPWAAAVDLDRTVPVNLYGPTETTMHCAYHRLGAADLAHTGRSVIGGPLADLTVHLLDAAGNLAPIGVPGEVYVGGPALARGYLNRPELTAERFVPDPYGPAGSRLYRTGDLGRRLADGGIEFLGRIDSQVKLRGYRIELGEIEAALREHASVRDAVVTVQETAPGGARLAAYLVGGPAGPVAAEELRRHLGARLPAYMVPASFTAIERVPRTVNGKTDLRALPAPEQEAYAATRFVAPRTPVEERLAAVWAEVLGLPRVGVEDSFFDLGGDSMRVVGLVGALRAAGYDLTVPDVFRLRTVAALAAEVAGQDLAAGSLVATVEPFALLGERDRAALPADAVDAYPLTQVQTGMLIELLTAEDGALYHSINSFRIPDTRPFSADALRAALDLVTERHEVLRTSVHLDGFSQPLQLVRATAEVPLAVHDLRGLADAERAERAGAYVAAERAAGFDLAAAPLLRIAVHVEGDDAWRLTASHLHAVTDGWTLNSLLMELLDCYRAVRDGVAPAGYEPPAVRYADYVAAELASLADAGDQAFWQRIVAEHSPLTLPAAWADEDGGAAERHGARVPYADLEEGLRRLATGARTSLKSVLLAAHLKVLGALTTEEAFHTGVVHHGRLEAPGADRVLGMHLNTLPFPATRGARTWHELVERVYRQETEVWAHRRYPLPAIQRATGGAAGSGAAGRLIAVLFDHQNFHQVDTGAVDVDAGLGDGATEFPLTAVAGGGCLTLNTTTAVLGREHLARLAAMYRAVLEAMAADPFGDASAAYLPGGERERLLALGTATAHRPVRGTLHEAFAAQAARTPDAVALTSGARQLSYRELNERANRLAHRLVALGAGPDVVVGVSLERDEDLVPTLLGVLKSGAAYLPLDPANPVERLGYMLADARSPILVSRGEPAARLAGSFGGALVHLDEDAAALAAQPVTDPVTATGPDHLSCVIYTSGSTGLPKGVTLTHGNVLRLFTAIQERMGFTAADVSAQSHSYAFDFCVQEMWSALLHGGRLVMVPPLVGRSPEDLLDLLVRERVTVLCQIPSAFRGLAGLAGAGDPRIDELALRAVVFGGERLEVAELRPWVDRVGLERTTLVNQYGPTEITVHCTYHVLRPEDFEHTSRSLLGANLDDLSIHLLDADGHLVPVGVPGELFVGGPGVARGYLDRPALTAERFVPDPFGPAGARMYRTGDLGRRLADGSIEFLSRVDNQIKIRGYRVELGEIEAALRERPELLDAVVVVRATPQGEKSLIAYVVGDGRDADPVQLRKHLAESLPEYMVPAAFVVLDALPLNASGKVNFSALPQPDLAAFGSASFVAPRTPVEERLAAVWAEVLGLARVGVEDSFFDLGGDSMRAVRLVGALRAAGFDVSIPDVFQLRTIAALAAKAGGRAAGESLIRAVEPFALIDGRDRAKLPADVVDAYPMSQVQTGMLVEMLAADSPHGRSLYHNLNSFMIRDERPFDAAALQRAVDTVVARHDILRTSMHLDGFARPMQLVHATAPYPVRTVDLRGLPAAEQLTAKRGYLRQEQEFRFDLATAPLMRISAVVESDAAWRLNFTYNHAISEGWSYNSLLMEVLECYRALRGGTEPAPYQAPAVRYADFVAAELASLADQGDQEFWQRLVDTHTPVAIPDGWALPGDAPRGHAVQVPFEDLEEGLRRLAGEARTSMKSVLLAAHLKVLGMLSAEEAFHTGVVYHGRLEAPGADRVLGMHLNTLPFPATRGGAATWRELVERVYARETEIWAHRRYPLPAIQRAAGNTRELLSILFEYLDFHHVDTDTVDVAEGLNDGVNEFTLNVVPNRGKVNLSTSTAVIGPEQLARLGRMYRLVMEAMAADPDGDAAASYLPEEPEPAEAGPAAPALTPELFAARAAATPDATAVVVDGAAVSYRELAERAERIARQLVAEGVRPGDEVGIRAAEPLSALYGIWRAGATYTDAPAAGGPVVTDATDVTAAGPDAPATTTTPLPRTEPERAAWVVERDGARVAVAHRELHELLEAGRGIVGSGGRAAWLVAGATGATGPAAHLALTTGARAVLTPAADPADPAGLVEAVDRQRITHLLATPAGWAELLAAGFDNYAVTALVDGEPSEDLAEELLDRAQRLISVHGTVVEEI
ncbi:amino acid adenylation domain-containing protein, partial [Kitasatospora misakiensis]